MPFSQELYEFDFNDILVAVLDEILQMGMEAQAGSKKLYEGPLGYRPSLTPQQGDRFVYISGVLRAKAAGQDQNRPFHMNHRVRLLRPSRSHMGTSLELVGQEFKVAYVYYTSRGLWEVSLQADSGRDSNVHWARYPASDFEKV